MDRPGDWSKLLLLIDDDSPRVRQAVIGRLRDLGNDPLQAMDDEGVELNPHQRSFLAGLRHEIDEERLDKGWELWASVRPDLESLHSLVATLLADYGGREDPRRLLDQWARRYLDSHLVPDLETLVPFLFGEGAIEGDTEDYFAPRNSSIVQALARRRGLPITLCSVLQLVGRRVGVAVDGVAFPGHFLARSIWQGRTVWIDCFDGGRFIGKEELLEAVGAVPPAMRDRVVDAASTLEISARILRNVVGSLERAEDIPRLHRAKAWLSELDARLRGGSRSRAGGADASSESDSSADLED
ncbi:MAG: hypothetical protein H6686_08025 [Fibrobacteria bacterium]|nr:hypothetical protein [Fibrobacteria bacterium]